MQSNKSRDTAPEMAVRRALHAEGLRFRVVMRPIPALRRTADIVFTRQMVAVFIDGCFWHACPIHYRAPKSNVEYWALKIARNVDRDAETTRQLTAAGWTVLRYWSHESHIDVAGRIAATVHSISGPQ
ncbi:very short patch repair endonuclease [Cryobacterium cheniae]|uniref:Very short patch repair endonuclease n=2 Tax=Cryobacterium cheniae TaxID=1259262 RepID=A0A4R8XWS2_9MICO|nr:very short patch repair endonuclease [Cryobacterium cheniae]